MQAAGKGTRANRRNILMRDKYKCQYCGKGATSGSLTIDHVLPVSRGAPSALPWASIGPLTLRAVCDVVVQVARNRNIRPLPALVLR